MWSDDAVWRLTGDHDLAKDCDPDSYFRMIGLWAERYPSFVPEFKEPRDLGEEGAMIVMESTNGMAPGVANPRVLAPEHTVARSTLRIASSSSRYPAAAHQRWSSG